MTVQEIVSGSGGAPTLTGQAGSLITALDFILVTTLGWTKTFSGTNKANYKPASGTQAVLYVDDSAPTTAKEARVCGFKTDSALGVGTGQFPTSSQSTIGTGMLVIRKSTTADATARQWRAFGDGTFFYLFTDTGDYTGPNASLAFSFGDFTAVGSGDTSNAAIIGRTAENTGAAITSNVIQEPFPQLSLPNSTSMSNTIAGHYTMANGINSGGSLAFGKHTDQTKMGWDGAGSGMQLGYLGRWASGGSNAVWSTNFNYPNPFDLADYVGKICIHQQGAFRGVLKNSWAPLQNLPFGHGDLIAGTGAFAGKNFRVINLAGVTNASTNSSGVNSQVLMEVP